MYNDYYVYEWFDQDTGYIFYVGKGRKDRCKQTSKTKRNKYFIRYYNKHNCDYRIIVSNLMESEALVFENEIILKYRKSNYCCCNFDDGGRNGGKSAGKNNGMYGKTHTDEIKQLLHDINSDGRHKGENNTQYNISPKDRMNSSVYEKWREKQKARKFGETNPNYKNDTLHIKYLNDPKLSKEKQSRPAEQNGRAIPIIMYDENMNEIKNFSYILNCVKYLIDNNLVKSKNEQAVYLGIYKSNKNNKPYYNYYFKY